MSQNDQSEQHPSYGCIRLNHVSGGDDRLFMSPLRHTNRIRLTISGAKHTRSLNSDWHMSNSSTMIEVDMSEQQFAQMISSFGNSTGAPCTIRRQADQMIEAPPVQLKSERHYTEAKQAAAEALAQLDSLQTDLELLTSKLPKKTQEQLSSRVASTRRILADHIPWIVQMIHEHMDKVVGAAKHEIQAEIARRLGNANLQLDDEAVTILALPAKTAT